jgi:transposase-like protein
VSRASPTQDTERKEAGRPSKFTAETQARINAAIGAGAERALAAKYAGIGESTLYRWLERGQRDERAGIESKFRTFWSTVAKTEAEVQMRALAMIKVAGAKNWRAAIWMLERRYPERWGRRGPPSTIRNERDFYIALDRGKERVAVLTEMGLENGWLASAATAAGDEHVRPRLRRLEEELADYAALDRRSAIKEANSRLAQQDGRAQ